MNILALSFGHFWRPCLRAQTQPALLFIKNATGGNSGGEGLHGLFPMSAVSLSATYKIKKQSQKLKFEENPLLNFYKLSVVAS